MSLLHLVAVLDDGSAMAAHLLRTQPWAAWSWLCLGWRAPGLPTPPPTANGHANGHHAALPNGNGNGVAATDGAEGDRPEDNSEEQEGDAEQEEQEEVLLPAPALTPGSLSVLLGKEAALRLAVSMVQRPRRQQQQQQGDGATAALLGALEEWSRSGATLLAALCEQFARQGL